MRPLGGACHAKSARKLKTRYSLILWLALCLQRDSYVVRKKSR